MIRFSPGLMLIGCLLAASGWNAEVVQAAELKFRVQLVWGTDDDKAKNPMGGDQAKKPPTDNKVKEPAKPDKPKSPVLKEVDPKLAENLKGIFKWKHYYEVFREDRVSVGNAMKKLRLSPKCEIEMRNPEKDTLEVKLYGEGKLVKTVRQAVPPGECLVMAGDDKNDTAWFVVISPL